MALWLGFAAVQWFTNLAEFTAEQASHGQPFAWGEFLAYWGGRFAENHSSESWQLAVEAILIMALGHRIFRRGTEDTDRLEAKLDELLARNQR